MAGRRWIWAALLAGVLIAGRAGARARSEMAATAPTTRAPVSAFILTIEGSSHLVAVGEAGFRRGGSGRRGVFSLELGSNSHDAAVLFAASDTGPVGPGTYAVDDRPGSPALHALVVTGSPMQPTGVYRAQAGTLTLRAAAGGQLDGTFDLWALGFTAVRPQHDREVITVAGSFTAIER